MWIKTQTGNATIKNFDRAKKVFENIFNAMADGQKVFTMPEDLDEEIFKEKAN